MQNTITRVLGFLMVFISGPQQERPRELKGGGHLLGETAEHFFSESAVGQLLRTCEAGEWKAVKQLAKAIVPASKLNAEDICAKAALVPPWPCRPSTRLRPTARQPPVGRGCTPIQLYEWSAYCSSISE